MNLPSGAHHGVPAETGVRIADQTRLAVAKDHDLQACVKPAIRAVPAERQPCRLRVGLWCDIEVEADDHEAVLDELVESPVGRVSEQSAKPVTLRRLSRARERAKRVLSCVAGGRARLPDVPQSVGEPFHGWPLIWPTELDRKLLTTTRHHHSTRVAGLEDPETRTVENETGAEQIQISPRLERPTMVDIGLEPAGPNVGMQIPHGPQQPRRPHARLDGLRIVHERQHRRKQRAGDRTGPVVSR